MTALEQALQYMHQNGLKWKRIDEERKELSKAIDTARNILNPKTYNVFNGGTFMGWVSANMSAYNEFRENL